MIKLVVADDSKVYRNGLKMALMMETNILVLGESSLCSKISDTCIKLQPDILLLGIPLNHQKALSLVKQIRETAPFVNIICLGLFNSSELFKKLRDAGCATHICKTNNIEEILNTIRQVYAQ